MFNNTNKLLEYLYIKYNILNKEKYKNTFIGLIMTFDLSKTNNIEDLITFIDDNIRLLGLHNVKKLYSNINESTNKNYLIDLKENYNKYNKYDNFDEIEKLTKYSSDIVNSVEEMLELLELEYKDIKANDYGIARLFFKNIIPQKIYNKLIMFREKQMKIDKSNIPYIKGTIKDLEYETVRLWDSYLMCFDIEHTLNGNNIELKENIMTNKNYRLITIKKNGKIINHIIVNKNEIGYEYNILKNDSNDYNMLIMDINNKIKSTNINYDPVKIYTPEQLIEDELEYFRINSIYKKAFDTSKLIVSDLKYMFKRNKYNENEIKNIYIGRDYFIYTNDDNLSNLYFYVVARHNEDINSKLGSIELNNELINIINSTNKLIEVDCYRTSYYMICKLARDGIIYIVDDNLENMGQTINKYRDNGNINLDFVHNKLNVKDNYSMEYTNNLCNNIKFYSVKNMNLNTVNKLELEKQKIIYEQIVNIIEDERKKTKYIDLNIVNLNIKSNYSKRYLNYILNKCSLGKYSIINLNDDNVKGRSI